MIATYVLFLSAICFQLFTYCHAGSQLTAEVPTNHFKVLKYLLCNQQF